MLRPRSHPSLCSSSLNALTHALASASSMSPSSVPTRRILSACCAHTPTGHSTAAPPSSPTTSLRRMRAPAFEDAPRIRSRLLPLKAPRRAVLLDCRCALARRSVPQEALAHGPQASGSDRPYQPVRAALRRGVLLQ